MFNKTSLITGVFTIASSLGLLAASPEQLVGKTVEIEKNGKMDGEIRFARDGLGIVALLTVNPAGEQRHLDLSSGQVVYEARVLTGCSPEGDTASFLCDQNGSVYLQFALQVTAAGDTTGEWMKRTYGWFDPASGKPAQDAQVIYEYHSYDGDGDHESGPIKVKLKLK
ncbi:MAG: hypothetical protein HY303_21350 [Candidatus Wallbacteria bacterium]|nr:hypothetical protein [Candidatus Wallbacteria bacterium]